MIRIDTFITDATNDRGCRLPAFARVRVHARVVAMVEQALSEVPR